MKTFIYLPLIALIILTGCKSNSFTTQRYTKYGHASHKKTIKSVESTEIVTAKQSEPEKAETEIVKKSINPVTIITAGVSTIKDAILKPERKVYDLNQNTVSATSTQASFSNDETVNTENSKQEFKSKRTFKQKVQKAEGLIGSAFITALWIVLVVIFICLIVFVLSAVF